MGDREGEPRVSVPVHGHPARANGDGQEGKRSLIGRSEAAAIPTHRSSLLALEAGNGWAPRRLRSILGNSALELSAEVNQPTRVLGPQQDTLGAVLLSNSTLHKEQPGSCLGRGSLGG